MEGSWDHSQQPGTEPYIKTVACYAFCKYLTQGILTLSVSTLTQAFCKYLNESLL